jgi:hypothetical protein
MNSRSVLLESLPHLGGGLTIRLDIDTVPSYSLFPGQVGSSLIVDRITVRSRNSHQLSHSHIPPPPPLTRLSGSMV